MWKKWSEKRPLCSITIYEVGEQIIVKEEIFRSVGEESHMFIFQFFNQAVFLRKDYSSYKSLHKSLVGSAWKGNLGFGNSGRLGDL